MSTYRNAEHYYDPTAGAALASINRKERSDRRKQIRKANAQRRRQPLVYICSPYAGDVEENVRNARRYSRFAVDKGAIPVTPHLLYPQFLNDANSADRAIGINCGNALLDQCSELWVFGNRISVGMDAEIRRAKARTDIRIRRFTEECEEVTS
jgi:hypothetical protein